jgi:hypothetical protein
MNPCSPRRPILTHVHLTVLVTWNNVNLTRHEDDTRVLHNDEDVGFLKDLR